MDPVADLTEFSREMLSRYSERCIEYLIGRIAGTLPASITKDLLRENVEKEVVKDRLVFERAIRALRYGVPFADADIDALFAQSQQIDRYFVQHLIMPSVSISLRFDDVEEIRKKRFRYLADFTADILEPLEKTASFGDAVRELFSAEQFHGFVGEVLFLHCVEVKKLARSVQFLPPFSRAMDMFVDEVVEAMEATRQEVAAVMRDRYFPDASVGKKYRPFRALTLLVPR